MFKDFDISFVDENDEALPIIILAGVNGSGKTTLLEYMKNFSGMIELNRDSNNFLIVEYLDDVYQLDTQFKEKYEFDEVEDLYPNVGINDIEKIRIHLDVMSNFLNSLIYYSTNTNIKNIKTLLPKYIENMIFVEGIAPFDSYKKVTEYMNEILKDLDTQIEFDSRDGDGNLFFRNKNGEDKFSIDELSTGEKTLMSKVLYLYLEDIKDKVILIDEPELSLHPSWQNKVLKIYENFAKQNNCQIIIATHSPHIIGSAKPEYIRVLKKVEDKIEVVKYNQSYGLEFSQILTGIMGVDYLRTPEVAKKMENVKAMIVQNKYDSDVFEEEWNELEEMLGKNYLDLKLLKLEIASRRKNASNN
jgi:predicted ATP-binding protein involved in virulence